jgi:hypothetical protein
MFSPSPLFRNVNVSGPDDAFSDAALASLAVLAWGCDCGCAGAGAATAAALAFAAFT